MILGTFFALRILPGLFAIVPISAEMGMWILAGAGISILLCASIHLFQRWYGKREEIPLS